ncbi:hypothetical protein [Nostoc sp. FACHB-145]|nr:hypothetical protein [Nostoc sp. FACHB-145]MBD2472384.1 hypothetical protein [Nostoc sp. FACHB-145]
MIPKPDKDSNNKVGSDFYRFGHSDLTKLLLAEATCSEFPITVIFEEVQQ